MNPDDVAVLTRLISARAKETPDRVYIEEVGGERRTYAELEAAAARWSAAVRTAGVQPGRPVLTMLPTSAAAVDVWFGLASAHAIETPINPAYRGQLLEHVGRNSGAELLIAHARYLPDTLEGLCRAGALRTVVVFGDLAGADLPDVGVELVPAGEFLAVADDLEPLPPPERHEISTMLYTSGTTGPSKGVLVPWAQLHQTSLGQFPQSELGPDDAFYCPFPLYHVTGKSSLMTMGLCGGRVVFRERFDTESFWSEIARYRCTTTVLLGAMVYFLLRQPEHPEDAETPLRNVVMVPLIPEVEEFKRRFDLRVQALWNMTEASTPICAENWDTSHWQSCGRVRPGYQIRVADDLDRPVPVGQTGELLLRADEPWTLMAGYWGNPEATAQAWRNQWFHTGDLVRQDEEGRVYFIDRKKDAIRRRGENISSQEVENAVYEHPDVQECAAIGVPSEWGEEEVMVCVVPKEGKTIEPSELAEFLAPRMAKFMLPRYIEVMERLPKTVTEKVRKVELRERGVTAATWDRLAGAPDRRAGTTAA